LFLGNGSILEFYKTYLSLIDFNGKTLEKNVSLFTKIIGFTDKLLSNVPGDYHDKIKKSISDVLFRNL
jgi:hypothetical protein